MEKLSNEIKKNVNLHIINTDKFKTNIISIFLTTNLNRENVTKNALIPAVLRRGTNKIKNQEEINKTLENMYGANFNCGIEKRGDNQILKFYIESLNNEFVPNNEDILKQSIDLLLDITLNPLIEQEGFNIDYINGEKENLKKIINAKIDNKSRYAYIRCIEEMYKNKKFGLYEYGYTEDLDIINEKELYKYYKELINNCKIDIFVSGKFKDKDKIKEIIINNEKINELQDRESQYVINSKEYFGNIEAKKVEEKMNVTQGKVIIGISIEKDKEIDYALNVYNIILGGGANSKLFQNVREKAGLAYTASSSYIRAKNNIFIKCGIEIKNYEKVIKIIKEQLEDIKQGKFSENDIINSKELIIASINSIPDEQANEISYYMSQELSSNKETIKEFIEKIIAVSKEDIINAANKISINTIYFLKN